MALTKNVIRLEYKLNHTVFLTLETFEYGTDKTFKTFSKAIKQAIKDLNSQIKYYINLDYCVAIELKISDSETVFREFKYINH